MPTSDYAPTTQDVARKMRSRTKDKFGNYVTADNGLGVQVPDFSSDTNPSQSEVSGLITDALDEVSDPIGSDIPEQFWPAAKRAVEWLVVANIELGYQTDQAGQSNSAYDKMYARYTTSLNSLQEDIDEEESEEAAEEQPIVPFGIDAAPVGWDWVRW